MRIMDDFIDTLLFAVLMFIAGIGGLGMYIVIGILMIVALPVYIPFYILRGVYRMYQDRNQSTIYQVHP